MVSKLAILGLSRWKYQQLSDQYYTVYHVSGTSNLIQYM